MRTLVFKDMNDDSRLIIRKIDFNVAVEKMDLKSMIERKTRPIGFVIVNE